MGKREAMALNMPSITSGAIICLTVVSVMDKPLACKPVITSSACLPHHSLQQFNLRCSHPL